MILTRISTAKMSHADWLEHRRHSIGGSDAAALLGMNPWVSPYALWADKTGRLQEKPDNEAMRQGRDLEFYVAQRWEETTGKSVRRCNAILKNSDYPWAHANIDRDVVGENAGLECKTTSVMQLKKFKNGEYPEQYYAQCVHYMAVTGADRWYLAVLILNQGFYDFVIERDQEEIDALMKMELRFWELVQRDTPPPADGRAATTEAMKEVYRQAANEQVTLYDKEVLLQEWKMLCRQEESIESRKEQIKQICMQELGDCSIGECGSFTVRWQPQTRKTFDLQLFAKSHPEIDLSQYYKETKYRKFEIRSEQ